MDEDLNSSHRQTSPDLRHSDGDENSRKNISWAIVSRRDLL